MFRIYEIDLLFNAEHFREVWIDPHYELKHSASINDELILRLLQHLDKSFIPTTMESKGFHFYEVDIEHNKKQYRMILVTPPDNSYLGVRNTYRRSR